MFSNIYFFLKDRAEKIEARLAETISLNQSNPCQEKIFSYALVFSNLSLVFFNITADLLKFFIILFSNSDSGFNVLFKQKELRSCPYSYHNYKLIRQKIRMFSVAGIASMVAVALVSSIVTNLIFGGKLPSFAATYGWTQADWSAGADIAGKQDHGSNISNPTGWLKFFSSGNINIANSQLSLATTSTTSISSLTTATGTNFYLNGTSVVMKKQNSAFCSATEECTNGGCDWDFATTTGSKYCHASDNCTDLTNSSGDYQRPANYKKCSGNSYFKNCNANGSWDAPTNNPLANVDCAAQGDPSKGGYKLKSESLCSDGTGVFTHGPSCHACTNNLIANATKDGCYANCATNDNAKCIAGYHCYATDSTCRSNALGNLCDQNSDCTSTYCLGGTCKSPPVACDGSEGEHTCGDYCTYNDDIYATVQIGTQCWFAENLRTTKKPDGVTDISATAYCNPAGCGSPWGRLYPWATAMNNAAAASAVGAKIQGICPAGWHIPSDYNASASDDFQKLSDYLGGDAVSGGKMKQTGTTYWASPNTGATNSSGFAAVAAGGWSSGVFSDRGTQATFRSSSMYGGSNAWFRTLGYFGATQSRGYFYLSAGYSIRCIKD